MPKATIALEDCPHHADDMQCEECAPEQRTACLEDACDAVLASVHDRRENGGTAATVRAKAFTLIEQLFADIEA